MTRVRPALLRAYEVSTALRLWDCHHTLQPLQQQLRASAAIACPMATVVTQTRDGGLRLMHNADKGVALTADWRENQLVSPDLELGLEQPSMPAWW